MDWTQVLTIVGSNIVLFLWSRTESRADYRALRQIIESIQTEMKDFHGRLCAIEERNKELSFFSWEYGIYSYVVFVGSI
jgi:hypothetical protein